ncbi:hypothetical protein P5W99_11145 [Paraburkholderia sp. A3BS-1L]|uniref:hypothetical protein n=1 Tax=Paraburkholderia sp. A3BS-1L TaxID=3028375 RepID=UPI003DA9FF67
MGKVSLVHAPASARRSLAQIGIPQTAEIDGVMFELPPTEMPGEAKWRGDFIQWLLRRTFHHLASLPRNEWVDHLLLVEADLVKRIWLHVTEAQIVIEGALATIQDLSVEDIQSLARGTLLFDGQLAHEGDKLRERYATIVRRHAKRAGHCVLQEAIKNEAPNDRQASNRSRAGVHGSTSNSDV